MNIQRRVSDKVDNVAGPRTRDSVAPLTVKLTVQELQLLTTLAADQLFRREFIEPKMPGVKSNSAEISLGKALVTRLRSIVDPSYAKKTTAARMAG
jgi:hypothetical protein